MANLENTDRGQFLARGLVEDGVARVISAGAVAQARSEWIDLSGALSVSVIISTAATTWSGTVKMYGFNTQDEPADSATATGVEIESHANSNDYTFSPFISSASKAFPLWAQWRITTYTSGDCNVDIKVIRLRPPSGF